MRIVFTGAGPTAVMTARELIDAGHEVIVIELDKDKIDRLSEELDCSFLQGDEIVILTRSEHLKELRDRWEPKQVEDDG